MFGTDFSPPILLVPHLLCWGEDAHRPLVWILKTVKRELIVQRIRRQTRWLDSGSCERGRGYRKKNTRHLAASLKIPPADLCRSVPHHASRLKYPETSTSIGKTSTSIQFNSNQFNLQFNVTLLGTPQQLSVAGPTHYVFIFSLRNHREIIGKNEIGKNDEKAIST